MTTQTDPETPDIRPSYSVSIWDALPCLLWAVIGLSLLSGWMWARSATFAGTDDLQMGAPFVIVPGVLAAIGLGLFLWAVIGRAKAKGDSTKLTTLGAQLRQLIWLFSLFAGGALLAVACWLLLAERKNHVFPEVSSLIAMGVICLVGCVSVRHTPNSVLSQRGILQWLLNIRQQMGIALMIVGLGLCIWGAIYMYRAGRADFLRFPGGPEGLGLVLIGLVLLGAGIFTQLTLEKPSTADTMRMLALYLGSLTGLVLFLATAMRAYWWGKEYLGGGIRSWQGPEAWRFWLCAYVGLFGLSLLFGSLLLSRVDIRVNAGIRRVLYGYNAFFTGILLLAMLVVVNIMVSVVVTANVQWNPKMGMVSLSSRSRTTLEGLKDRVTVYVLMTGGSHAAMETRDMLDNCQNITDKLSIVEVSPDLKDVEYKRLVDKYPELAERTSMGPGGKMSAAGGRGLLIVYGEGAAGKKVPHAFISEQDLEDFDPSTQKRKFMGEKLLMQNIRQLEESGASRPKIYFTQNNGELWLNDADLRLRVPSERLRPPFFGAGEVAEMLRKDNYDVQGLIWETKNPAIQAAEIFTFSRDSDKDPHIIPKDCSVLVIANPEKPFPKNVLEAIDRYMDKDDGKLFILTNPNVTRAGKFMDDGMEDLCKKYNVQVTKDYVLRYTRKEDPIDIKASVVPNTPNKVAREFVDRVFYFYFARTVAPLKMPGNYQAEAFIHATKEANGPIWGETDTAPLVNKNLNSYVVGLEQSNRLAVKASPEPLPMAVAVTDRDGKPRVMVVGDAGIISTTLLKESREATDNYDFFRSSLAWLSNRTIIDIGISPKETDLYRPKEVSKMRLILLPLSLLVLTLGGMGAGIWIVRRK